jgi:hypothetical protein
MIYRTLGSLLILVPLGLIGAIGPAFVSLSFGAGITLIALIVIGVYLVLFEDMAKG